MKTAPRLGILSFWLAALLLVWFNIRFYSRPGIPENQVSAPVYAEGQLKWLREQLDHGAGDRMQALFPEGWFFTHLLYGLAHVELALRVPARRDAALAEARWCLAQIETEKGREPFSPELRPDHGMFYSAWRNHLLSGILLIQEPGKRNPEEWAEFEQHCEELADTLQHSATPFPASYPGRSWPCDTLPAVHSLKVRCHLAGDSKYDPLIRNWLTEAWKRADPATGLLPHEADHLSGRPLGPARATSASVILRFLLDIEPETAAAQYLRFRDHFLVNRLGLPGFLEYPKGIPNRGGDVDSGPLIAGVSLSATLVAMGDAALYGDPELARSISQCGEALGFPVGNHRRRYLGGMLPVADAFLVHATTARPWLPGKPPLIPPHPLSRFWRAGIHLVSLAILLALRCAVMLIAGRRPGSRPWPWR